MIIFTVKYFFVIAFNIRYSFRYRFIIISTQKTLIQIIILFSFTYYNDLYISDLKIDILNDLLLNNDFKFIFITFCFLILVNGSNFIDGCDGLNIGYFAIVIFIILYCINYYDLEYDF